LNLQYPDIVLRRIVRQTLLPLLGRWISYSTKGCVFQDWWLTKNRRRFTQVHACRLRYWVMQAAFLGRHAIIAKKAACVLGRHGFKDSKGSCQYILICKISNFGVQRRNIYWLWVISNQKRSLQYQICICLEIGKRILGWVFNRFSFFTVFNKYENHILLYRMCLNDSIQIVFKIFNRFFVESWGFCEKGEGEGRRIKHWGANTCF